MARVGTGVDGQSLFGGEKGGRFPTELLRRAFCRHIRKNPREQIMSVFRLKKMPSGIFLSQY